MKRKIIMSFLYFCFSIFLVSQGVGNAQTFVDDFDNQTFTNANWDDFFGFWDFEVLSGPDFGYHGQETVGEVAGALADNSRNYYNAEVTIETDVILRGAAIEENNAGLFFSYYEDSGDDYEYAAFIKYYPDDINFSGLYLERGSSVGSYYIDTLNIPSISLDTLYTIEVNTSLAGLISVYLYDGIGNPLGSLLNNSPDFSMSDNGGVGIFTLKEATFNNFSLTGNPVPIPGAVWLLGSGLVGIAGFRRKNKKT